MTVFFLDWVNS